MNLDSEEHKTAKEKDKEKKAIESLIEIREFANLSSYKDVRINQLNAIDIILNLIQKQSKVIDEMAGYLAIIRDCPNEDKGANLDCENRCNNTDEIYEECWKQYFYRKVENE